MPSGLYFVQFTGPDGRVGYAPFVVRPAVLGATDACSSYSRPTPGRPTTSRTSTATATATRGTPVPERQRRPVTRVHRAGRSAPLLPLRPAVPALAVRSGKTAEFISDSDFDQIANGDALARAYDFVVFEGHTEYVTAHEYDVVQRFRDLGGNLMFLSANNFFWKVEKHGQVLRKIGKWRDAGRPEAALIGVQYRANDDGQKQGLFTVANTRLAPGSGRAPGSSTARRSASSSAATASRSTRPRRSRLPARWSSRRSRTCSGRDDGADGYYETAAGAKVFAAGTLDFGGSATFWPVKQILDNLWARLSQP